MALGTSLLLIAIGAILRFAVHVSTSGFSLHTIGVILMIVGVIGLAVTLLMLNGGAGGWYGGRRTTVVDDGYVDDPAVVSRRRVIRRRDVL